MTQGNATGEQGPSYQLEMSRIFDGQPSSVRRAFTHPDLRAQWVRGRSIPDLFEAVEGEPLTWVEHVGGGETSEGDPGATRSVRIQLFDEPPGKTRLELRARPYAQAEEIDARAWWDSAFSHLDNVLERGV